MKTRYKIIIVVAAIAVFIPGIIVFGPVLSMIASNAYSGYIMSSTPDSVFEKDFVKIPEVNLFIEKYPDYTTSHTSDFLGWKIINYDAYAGNNTVHLSVKKSVLHQGVRVSAGCSLDDARSYALNILDDDVLDYLKNDLCMKDSSGGLESDKKPASAFSNEITEIINPKHGKLQYYATVQVIDDQYLGKTVDEWQKTSHYELGLQYDAVPEHKFYGNLGNLLMKNEMTSQMQMLGIENADDDFTVLQGSSLQSNPPHIGYSSIVHATDGHYYLLSGGTHANQVNYYKTTQLQYPDESKFPKIKTTPNFSDDGKIPRITITEVGGNDLKAEPYSVILPYPGDVEFYNKTPEKLTVYLNQEGVEEFSFDTSLNISTRSNSGMAYPFDDPGVYSFHAQTPKNIDGKEYELNTGGAITVLADDMSDLPKAVQVEIAKEILISSELPITGMGQRDTDDVIFIGLNHSIEQLLPESKPYYLKAAQSLMPFDIQIALR